jgi:haloacetate dehalogenase
VVCPDLRGYGFSDKPAAGPDHAEYAKRAMAGDLAGLMAALGFASFAVAAHDRGARAAHRLALDHPDAVERLCLIDIVPTLHVFETLDPTVAAAYEHWFSLLPTDGVPEHLIGLDPEFYLTALLARWSASTDGFAPEAVTEYLRAFAPPEAIRAMCEDYRAGASIDLDHDRADRDAGRRIACPLHLLWGAQGLVGRRYDVLDVWRGYADGPVTGAALDCGHFVPEEKPAETLAALEAFFA